MKLKSRIKCFFGMHEREILGFLQPFFQQSLGKCKCCGKYELYHYGLNMGYWTHDITQFPREIQHHIKKHNL